MVNPRPHSHSDVPPDGRFARTRGDEPAMFPAFDESFMFEGFDPDDVFLVYDDGFIAHLSTRFKEPTHKIAVKRGWSTLVGNTATPSTPRGGAPWTEAEQRDLLVAAAGKIDLSKLARTHGRTEHAIATRLEALGVDRTTIVASDFEPVAPHPSPNGVRGRGPDLPAEGKPRVRLCPLSRARTLLQVAIGFSCAKHLRRMPQQDMAFLLAQDLIDHPPGVDCPVLTDKGREAVEAMLGRAEKRPAAQVAWNEDRRTNELTEGTFYMVASGDLLGGRPVGRLEKSGRARPIERERRELSGPPRVVQPTEAAAEAEALRIASLNPGDRMFVLKAVSVHQRERPKPQPPATTSKRV